MAPNSIPRPPERSPSRTTPQSVRVACSFSLDKWVGTPHFDESLVLEKKEFRVSCLCDSWLCDPFSAVMHFKLLKCSPGDSLPETH